MAKIRGNYNLLASMLCNYTIANNNRSATFDNNVDKIIDLGVMANDNINTPIKGYFNYENNFTIKRARLICSGVENARPALNSLAARLNFAVVAGLGGKKLDNSDGDTLTNFALYFNKWEEWTEFNINVSPYKTKVDWSEYLSSQKAKPCSLMLLEHAQFFSIDDFNFQSIYAGEKIYPYIEFEIDTAGLVLADGSII